MPPSLPVPAPDAPYLVVVNSEGQYSIWPARRPVPDGWRADGRAGTEAECLDRIARIWTDTRPLSARTFAGTAR
ncbi:MbtH family protein [Streptomyces sp. NPDC050508]|uniref:MbtH family protein n=1 Tax=Streptomyces sp. NPDC050508 TaxID=3155405 RepID=UPI00341EA8EE